MIENSFQEGDVVRIICQNSEATLPDGVDNAVRLGNHRFRVGEEFTIPDPNREYDEGDNSWLLRRADGGKDWVHEGALEDVLPPVTQAEEDEAMASIMKALGQ